MPTTATCIQHCTRNPKRCNKIRKRKKIVIRLMGIDNRVVIDRGGDTRGLNGNGKIQ